MFLPDLFPMCNNIYHRYLFPSLVSVGITDTIDDITCHQHNNGMQYDGQEEGQDKGQDYISTADICIKIPIK